MNCQSCRSEIEELDLGERLSDAASAHVEACLPCGAFYDERLSLRRLVGSLEPVTAPSDFDFRLRARLAAGGHAGNHRFSLRSFIASAPAIGLAASFALLVAGVVIYTQFKTERVTSRPAVAVENKAESSPQPAVASSPAKTAVSILSQEESPANQNTEAGSIVVPATENKPRQSVAANSRNSRRSRQAEGNAAQIESHDEAVRPAPQIRPAPGSQFTATTSNPLVELPVRSPSQPVRVFVDDRSGGRRSVTLEPVIFGSQDLTGRGGFRPVSSQGIW